MPKVPSPENVRLEIFINVNWIKLGGLFSTSKQEADIVVVMLNLGLNVVPWKGLAPELVKLNKAWAVQMANIKMSQRARFNPRNESDVCLLVDIPNTRFLKMDSPSLESFF